MIQNTIRDIRKHCRLAMNGVASTSMREKGLTYKINFGLTLQQIKDLSKQYQPNAELAEALWKEDTRELKILATLLFPLSDFTKDIANKWSHDIPNQEIREQVCFNLFQNLSFANDLIYEWVNNVDENIRSTGYWLLARLSIQKKLNPLKSESFSYIWSDVFSENTFLRNAAILALKHLGRQSEDEARSILDRIAVYQTDEDPIKKETYDNLHFEFNYYFE